MKKKIIATWVIVSLIFIGNLVMAKEDGVPFKEIWEAISDLRNKVAAIQLVSGPQGEKGEKGERGEIGPQGPQGESGQNDSVIINGNIGASTDYKAGSNATSVAQCPEGKVLLGGGAKAYQTSNQIHDRDLILKSSYPINATTWFAEAILTSDIDSFGGVGRLHVATYAICSK